MTLEELMKLGRDYRCLTCDYSGGVKENDWLCKAPRPSIERAAPRRNADGWVLYSHMIKGCGMHSNLNKPKEAE